MTVSLERHIRALAAHPSGPDATEPHSETWAQAAEAVGMKMLADGRAVYTMLADNISICDAVRDLICERSRDVTTIAARVDALREAVREAAREYAQTWHDGAVAEQYALMLREEAAGNVD